MIFEKLTGSAVMGYHGVWLNIEHPVVLQEREPLSQLLNQTEDWLYDEGEDQSRQVYIDKLASLKVSAYISSAWRIPVLW